MDFVGCIISRTRCMVIIAVAASLALAAMLFFRGGTRDGHHC
jgi:hypothetical protein